MLFRRLPIFRRFFLLYLLCIVLSAVCAAVEPSTASVAAFNAYANSVESQLARQHHSPESFLAPPAPQSEARLHRGELVIERLTPSTSPALAGAALYHWRGTAFAPGATAADFERLMKDFNSYPRHFSPQVLETRVLTQDGNHLQVSMRVRQQHVLTVVLDTTYDVTFGHLDPTHGYSLSRSVRIAEVAAPGTSTEHTLSTDEEHGFLWRQNTYWSYEERDGGLYMQIESISLTRSIPTGLGWVIGPYIESIPRESLDFTLRSAVTAIKKGQR
jgi:hypothetical protein